MSHAPRPLSASASEGRSHAVSRSNELLSCCKTAWKIHQQANPMPLDQPPPPMPTFRLATIRDPAPTSLVILEEGLTLLRSMEFGLKQLQVLVRRRGHTNDPTQEIAQLVQQLEQDTQELTDFCQQLLRQRRRSPQAKKHWEFVVQWFQQVAQHYSAQLQTCLKVRGDVLADQALQRKKLTTTSNKSQDASSGTAIRGPTSRTRSAAAAASATPLFDSPLFKAPPRRPAPPPPDGMGAPTPSQQPFHPPANGSAQSHHTPFAKSATKLGGATARPGYYGGGGYGGAGSQAAGGGTSSYYGGASSSGGYGGLGSGTQGMRQRKGGGISSSTMTMDYNSQQQEEEEKIHHQIQQRQQKRQTQQRLDEARQAETMLGELGQVFGKMSTLISQQGEVLEKIEDDVEAAHTDVIAGQEELTNLYSLKKGNRPLIIKVFLILNFLIVFMKAYKR